MPKYQIELTITGDFELDTDEFKEELAEAEVDPNDEDQIHDFLRSEDAETLIQNYNIAIDLQEIKVTTKKK